MTKPDAKTATLTHLADALGLLQIMQARLAAQQFEAAGMTAHVTWSDAADAERMLNDLLDIEQRTHLTGDETTAAEARAKALAAARATYVPCRCGAESTGNIHRAPYIRGHHVYEPAN